MELLGLIVIAACLAAEPPDTHPETKQVPSPKNDPGLVNPGDDHRAATPAKPKTPDVPAVEPTPSGPAAQRTPAAIAPPRPAITAPAPIVPMSATPYPEGSLLTAIAGTLVQAGDGDTIFVPDAPAEAGGGEASRPKDPPMVLLPSLRLGQIRASTSGLAHVPRVTMGGQVFVYHGRNYLLPTAFALVREGAGGVPVGPAGGAGGDAGGKAVAASGDKDPRVEDLIRSLEAERTGSRSLEPGTPRTAAPTRARADESAAAPANEGTLLSLRRGRLVRQDHDAGRFAFVFDNDPNSRASGPMPLLPCRLLERMEQVASWRGEDLVFKVSGRITTFDGRNYLMPITFQLTRASDVTPMQ